MVQTSPGRKPTPISIAATTDQDNPQDPFQDDPGLSLADFLALPETQPASEFLAGKIRQKPMPKGKHSRLQAKLLAKINQRLNEPVGGMALPELRCVFGGRAIVPDIAVFRPDQLPWDETGEISDAFDLAPDWVIEILSPGQSLTDLIKKAAFCLEFGTEMVWLLDPHTGLILVFFPGGESRWFDRPEQVLPLPEFVGSCPWTLREIFGLLKRTMP